jgi:hypothetical protein
MNEYAMLVECHHNTHMYTRAVTTLLRMNAIKAPHTADWKAALRRNKQNTLSDAHYRIAALMNLGLIIRHLPAECQGCGGKNIVGDDPYHVLHIREKRSLWVMTSGQSITSVQSVVRWY